MQTRTKSTSPRSRWRSSTACGNSRPISRTGERDGAPLQARKSCAPANWPRESIDDGNDQLDGDRTLDILLGLAGSRCYPGLRYERLQRKGADQNGVPQISIRFHVFAACYPRGLYSATELP